MDTQMCFAAVLLCLAKLAASKGSHSHFPVSSSPIFLSDFFGRPDAGTDGSDQAPLFPSGIQNNKPNALQSYFELDYSSYYRVLCQLTSC